MVWPVSYTHLMLYIAFLPFMLIYGWGIRKPMRRYGEQEQQARREQSRLVDVYKRQVHLNVRNTILYKACFIWCTSRCNIKIGRAHV